MGKTEKINLTEGSPFRVIMQFTLPVIGGNLFQLFYTLADSIIVGKTLGTSSLAAVGATSIIAYFVLCFIQGMTNGFGIYLAQKAGEGKLEEIKKRSCGISVAESGIYGCYYGCVLRSGTSYPEIYEYTGRYL